MVILIENSVVGTVSCWTLWCGTRIMGKVDGWGTICGVTTNGRGMGRFWQTSPVDLVLSIAILAVLVAVAFYVHGKIRPKPLQKELKAHEWLTKCREMHSKGVLSDEEFRTIKTTLTPQLKDELNDNGEEG